MESNWVTKKLATNRCKRMKTLCMCCFNYLKHQPQNCMSCGLWQMAGPKPLSQLKMFQWSWLEHFVDLKALNFFPDSRKGYQKTYGAHGSEIRFPTTWRISEPSTVSAIWLRYIHWKVGLAQGPLLGRWLPRTRIRGSELALMPLFISHGKAIWKGSNPQLGDL